MAVRRAYILTDTSLASITLTEEEARALCNSPLPASGDDDERIDITEKLVMCDNAIKSSVGTLWHTGLTESFEYVCVTRADIAALQRLLSTTEQETHG